ncbi:uncharacterized protein LOC125682285 [Ostrea edulis]|uniref:uncharacterized protein LOC125682285 n=1 Tax=Ostrea edulis TaxID=37623 RepID=UPI0020964641|nr:uncharacterized protein LOC125682285 [Ostrea edulis]
MIGLVLVLVVSGTFAAPHSDHTQSAVEKFKSIVRTQVTTLWTTVDTDGDGHFESADMHHIFDDYDANHDHKVSQQEFVSRFAHNEPELNIIAQGLFYEFDMNRDGFVTVSDLDLYYQKIDTNDNGHVEKEEFVHYFTEIFTILYVIQLNQTTPSSAVGR